MRFGKAGATRNVSNSRVGASTIQHSPDLFAPLSAGIMHRARPYPCFSLQQFTTCQYDPFVCAYNARRNQVKAEAGIAKIEGRKYRVEHNLEKSRGKRST
jgi:hypothetical protein